MMESTLTGSTFGKDRAEVTSNAKAIAARYFGQPCILVELSNEQADVEHVQTGDNEAVMQGVVFSADFRAIESHRLEARSYGPAICRDCKRESWPQDPLPNGLLS